MFQYNSNMPPLFKHVWRPKAEAIRFLMAKLSLSRYNLVTVRFSPNLAGSPIPAFDRQTPE